MSAETKPTLPVIHLNGSSPTDLLSGYELAIEALSQAVDQFRKIDIHPRDYYPAGDDAWTKASSERSANLISLGNTLDYLNAVADHIREQIEKREAARRPSHVTTTLWDSLRNDDHNNP